MRKIALADIPAEYYTTQPLSFRGNISTVPIKKTTDISKIPQQIWIKKNGTSGRLPKDFEQVMVDLSTHSAVGATVDLPQPSRLALLADHHIEAKRERLIALNEPLLHYRDQPAFERLYNAAFNQPLVNSEQSIPDLTPKIKNRFRSNGASAANRTGKRPHRTAPVSAANAGLNVIEKWPQLQTHLLNNGQVVLDLEIGHSNELTRFDDVIDQVQQYGLQLDPFQVRKKRRLIEVKLLQATVNRLQEINNRLTIVSGNFQVEERQNHYRLIHSYPITQVSKRESTLVIEVPKQDMESGWTNFYERLLGAKIQAHVFGSILSSTQIGRDYWEIAIKPIVVYSSPAPQGG